MKSFKLVITGTVILMLSMLVCIKTNTDSTAQEMQETSIEQQEIVGQQHEVEDGLLVYPSCLPATLPYQ